MISGAAGKIGTGAYSLDVVFHSLANQANINGNSISINFIEQSQWNFGDIVSDGKLGNYETLDKGRSISDLQA